MQLRKRYEHSHSIDESTVTHLTSSGEVKTRVKANRKHHLGHTEVNMRALSAADRFDSRKVVVRIDHDGEPCSSGDCKRPHFDAMYFIRWLTFDDNQPRQYAECSRDPIVESANADDMKELSIGSKRRLTHMAPHSSTCTIPVAAVYFIHADLARISGLDPDPDQDSHFPELVKQYDGPIKQPFRVSKDHLERTEPVIKANRISRDELQLISTVGKGLDVRISRIPNSGRGVFALRNFEQGEIVTLYFGHPFGEAHRKLLQEEGRGTHAKPVDFKHKYLDGVKSVFMGMHAAQLLNQGSSEACNCDWATLELRSNNAEKILAIRAVRDIKAGEELYISYGKKYWDEIQKTPHKVPPLQISRSS